MKPFKIAIPEQQLHDLSNRLKQVRWPSRFSENHGLWGQIIPF
jgi:hypothetical protein